LEVFGSLRVRISKYERNGDSAPLVELLCQRRQHSHAPLDKS